MLRPTEGLAIQTSCTMMLPMYWLRWSAACILAITSWFAPRTQAAPATTARLLVPVQTVRAGETFLAAVRLESQKDWHTYWRHGGDSGAPTTIDWQLPQGFTAGPIQWPAPERYTDSDLVTYVHHGTTFLLVPITVAPDAPQGPANLAATVRWLECKTLCVQAKADVRAQVTVGTESVPSPDAPTLEQARGKLPPPLPDGTASAAWDGPGSDSERALVLSWTAPDAPGQPDFFPDAAEAFEVSTATERPASAPPTVVLRKKVRKWEGEWPTEIRGLLVRAEPGKVPSVAYEVRLPIASATAQPPAAARGAAAAVRGTDATSATFTNSRAAAPATLSSDAAPAATATPRSGGMSLIGAIAFGFLGGLILNIMPCVLPVIALKILGFVRQSGSNPGQTRRLGLVYGFGVWFSFLVLAGVVVAVKKAAGIASWGMQFGNPVFLVILTTLILLVALSLFGVFEINLGGGAMDAAGDLASKEGSAGAFFNGMLAVALATPCTAPFLAPALGYAFAANTPTVVTVFSAVAFGLAAPYVVLSWKPDWLRFLPKPGQWMVRFKVAMGFPMLATAVWLFALTANHFGDGGPLWLGLFLVLIALSAWVWGEFAQRGRRHASTAAVCAILLAGVAYAAILEGQLGWRSSREPRNTPAPARNAAATAAAADEIPWQPWSREAVEAARNQRKVVFVDFTADWCLTCKLNERSSIDIESVRRKLRDLDAVALKGDHTRLPRAISEELQRFERAGVPLVLVYPRDPARPPAVLPEVLTPGIVLEALDQAAR